MDIFVWEGIDEDAVRYAEDGGGGADAEDQGEDSGEGKAGILAQLAKCIAEVLKKDLHGLSLKLVLALFRQENANPPFFTMYISEFFKVILIHSGMRFQRQSVDFNINMGPMCEKY